MSYVKIPRIITDAGRSLSSFPNEENDCSVRALSLACDIPYDEAHQLLAKWGRKNKKLAYNYRDFCESYLRRKAHIIDVNLSMNKFLALNPKGTYIVHVYNHAFCMKDGVVYDRKHRYISSVEWVARMKS